MSEDYEEIALDVTLEEELLIMRAAHKLNISVNEYINLVLREEAQKVIDSKKPFHEYGNL